MEDLSVVWKVELEMLGEGRGRVECLFYGLGSGIFLVSYGGFWFFYCLGFFLFDDRGYNSIKMYK